MDFFNDIKAATTAIVVGRDRSLTSPSLIAQATGINRFGVSGFGALELAPAENNRLMRIAFKETHYGFIVLDWVASRFSQPKPVMYEIKEQKSFSKYSRLDALQKKDSYSLRNKAIEEVEEQDDYLFQLLKKPNPYQDWAELAYETNVYWNFGNALLYGVRLTSGSNKGQVREIYTLPTAYYAGKNASIAGYEYYVDNLDIHQIAGADVLHLRRFNPDAENQQQRLWGMAKFTPARRLLAKSNNAIEAEAEAMQNRGGRTLIFPKATQYQQEDPGASVKDATEALRKKLRQAGTNGVAGFNVEIGAIEIGMSPVDLNIIESTQVSKEDYAALMGVNVLSVFSSMSGSTFANKEEADKQSIRTGVLPDLSLFGNKLNDWLLPAYNAQYQHKRYIEFNTDVFPELQVDKAKLMAWMTAMGSSINERREAAGYSRIDSPVMDVTTVPSNLVPVTDFAAGENEPDPENEGTY